MVKADGGDARAEGIETFASVMARLHAAEQALASEFGIVDGTIGPNERMRAIEARLAEGAPETSASLAYCAARAAFLDWYRGDATSDEPISTRVLFLGFDGVLNTWLYLNRARESADYAPHDDLDPAGVARVDRIVAATGARVVLTTNWRRTFTFGELREILARAGLRAKVEGEVGDRSGAFARTGREHEIAAWLEAHPEVTDWIAIDDLPLDLPLPRLVRTDESKGILDEHVESAIAALSPSSTASCG